MTPDDYLNMHSMSINISMPSSAFQALQVFLMAISKGEPDDVCNFLFRALGHIQNESLRMQVANGIYSEIMRLFVVIGQVDDNLGQNAKINIEFNPNFNIDQKEKTPEEELDNASDIKLCQALGFECDAKLKDEVEKELQEFEEEEKKKKENGDLGFGEPDPDTWGLD